MPDGGGAKHPVGENVEAGLPNITGKFGAVIPYNHANHASGAIYGTTIETNTDDAASTPARLPSKIMYGFGFDASRSNSIYGASDTVQPPAYTVYVYKRIA